MDLVKGLGFRKGIMPFSYIYEDVWGLRSEVAAVLRLGNWAIWSREIGE